MQTAHGTPEQTPNMEVHESHFLDKVMILGKFSTAVEHDRMILQKVYIVNFIYLAKDY